jgi:hypothetical protein
MEEIIGTNSIENIIGDTIVADSLVNDTEVDFDETAKEPSAETQLIPDSIIESTNENTTSIEKSQNASRCQFAVSRIKSIMKLDPELSLTSKESVFLVAKATVI